MCRRSSSHRRRRTLDLVELLAITLLLTMPVSRVQGCQQIDLFSHYSTVCSTQAGKEVCKIQLSEVFKINPYKRNACIRLVRNSTIIHELRVSWKSLVLSCVPATEFFTRETEYKIVDSKRCPHSGSCTGLKCAEINSSSLIPELEPGNTYPGVTYCVESCGGPGCDCFYWSSGCLFYRIYAVPQSDQIFEILRCSRWTEAAKVEFLHYEAAKGQTSKLVAHLTPNVPIQWNRFTFTLTSITVPPTPLLNTFFISDGTDTSLWDSRLSPALYCDSLEEAQRLECDMRDDCTCYPAETKANCKCKTSNVKSWFDNIQHRLPVVTPAVSFRRNKEGTIQARISSMTTSEIIVSIQDEFETEVVVDKVRCTVTNAGLTGCYNCVKGAQASIACSSSKPTQAEIRCNDNSFTIPCDKNGINSILRFNFDRARIHLKCHVSCGNAVETFEMSAVLKYTHTAQAIVGSWLEGKATEYNEIKWPDLLHIADVFWQWYKTATVIFSLLLAISLATYLCLSTCGFNILCCTFRLMLRMLRQFFRVLFRIPFTLSKGIQKMHEKLL